MLRLSDGRGGNVGRGGSVGVITKGSRSGEDLDRSLIYRVSVLVSSADEDEEDWSRKGSSLSLSMST